MREKIMKNDTITYFNTSDSDKYADTKRGITMTTGNFMTESTRDRIHADIRNLEEKRPEITDRISEARLQGGLEENEELLMALEDMQRLDMEMNRLSDQLINVSIIQQLKPGKKKVVVIGTTVTILNVDNDTEVTYTILGVHDSDPNNGIISFKSPLGAELLGREVDDEIEVNDTQYEIIKIVAKKLQ
jgi:transcription elongation factor GreA